MGRDRAGTVTRVHPDKVRLLFGDVSEGFDPDDPGDRSLMFADDVGDPGDPGEPAGRLRGAVLEMIANQIDADDPPEVWATAQRLVAAGLDRRQILRNLVLVGISTIQETLAEGTPFDEAGYRSRLEALPLPLPADLMSVFEEIAGARPGIEADELDRAVAARFGADPDDQPFGVLLDRVFDLLLERDRLGFLSGDRVVAPAALCDGIVLTHRLTPDECDDDTLELGADLAAFAYRSAVLRDGGGDEWEPCDEDGPPHWHSPPAALDRFGPGALVAVRVRGNDVEIEALDADPDADLELVDRLAVVFGREVADTGLPVAADDLVRGLLVDEPDAFDRPRPPLTVLCRDAGLDVAGLWVADDPDLWRNQRHVAHVHACFDELDGDKRDDALAVVAAAHDPDDATLAVALGILADPSLLDFLADELIGDADPDLVDDAAAFADRLLSAARKPRQVAAARWWAAVVAERRLDPLGALGHLEAAVAADDGWWPALYRLAWYRSDQGDADGAARLWRRLPDVPAAETELGLLEQYTASGASRIGRNEPCWCGSGRKYKACHLGRAERAPLPDRVRWLVRKTHAYLERRGGDVAASVVPLALVRAGHLDALHVEAVRSGLDDPLVIDVALNEGGWLARFLAERGPLLPDDERLLAEAWALVDRSVFEIVSARPGHGIYLRDLRTGEVVPVRERTFSHQAEAGRLLCARAVPDGQGHQVVGGVFAVAPGAEAELLDLLDRRDPAELLAWRSALDRPPVLLTRENEPLMECRAELAVAAGVGDAVRAALAERYEPEDDDGERWVELTDIEGDRVLRATLILFGDRLTVETMSEARLDRVLDTLQQVPGLTLLDERREPMRAPALGSDGMAIERFAVGEDALEGDAARTAMHAWRDRYEERWCDEPVPALDGRAPRDAAADPVARERLERLLASYPEPSGDQIGMRPSRLRGLLDLS